MKQITFNCISILCVFFSILSVVPVVYGFDSALRLSDLMYMLLMPIAYISFFVSCFMTLRASKRNFFLLLLNFLIVIPFLLNDLLLLFFSDIVLYSYILSFFY